MTGLTPRNPASWLDADLHHAEICECRAASRQGCWQQHARFVMFMRNSSHWPNGGQEPATDCTISASRLHVVLTADLLIVTEADDLHEPGRCISARQILGFSRWSMFQLLDTPAPGIRFERHVAAAGIAVLTWQDRHRRLKVFGFAAGFPVEDDCIFDAIECDHC